MKIFFNGRVLKNVKDAYKPIADQIPDLCEYLETTRVHPDEELKFNQALLEYRWDIFLEKMKAENLTVFNWICDRKPESYFKEIHRNGSVAYVIVSGGVELVRVDKSDFEGVKVAGEKYHW